MGCVEAVKGCVGMLVMLLMMIKIVYSSLREVYLKFYYDYDKDKYGTMCLNLNHRCICVALHPSEV